MRANSRELYHCCRRLGGLSAILSVVCLPLRGKESGKAFNHHVDFSRKRRNSWLILMSTERIERVERET